MKKILVCVILLSSFLFASDVDLEKEKRTKAAIAKAIEKENAREKVFYDYESYDFKDSEVNEESLKTLKAKEVDDLDMDDVYD